MSEENNELQEMHAGTVLSLALFREQCDIVKNVAVDVVTNSNDLIFPLLVGLHHTGRAIVLVSQETLVNEITMLSRAFLERAVNSLYLDVCEQSEKDAYRRYSLSKGARSLNRSVQADGRAYTLQWSGYARVWEDPPVQEAIAHFTSSRGRQMTRWTNTGICDRISLLEKRVASDARLLFLFALMVYEDASEALHGTGYGCTFHFGRYLPGTEAWGRDGMISHWYGTVSLLVQFAADTLDLIISHYCTGGAGTAYSARSGEIVKLIRSHSGASDGH